ncbi:VOC family protein [Amycolatopsis pithecellobii]|uniref:VOC domain-containing protein n=1 Tax=Amycolatopsis pithecellobii TaxID=664692 RepID=A0A6N7Z3J1_9PSEU|nr:VOC family protein [Amycolatopsis pithecellobii]MTD54720.1 hypothetical protein [Amycolatopsis pithecellobii]
MHTLFRELLGHNRGKYFLLTGETLDARQCLDLGLVSEVVPRTSSSSEPGKSPKRSSWRATASNAASPDRFSSSPGQGSRLRHLERQAGRLVTRIHHANIRVSDPRASLNFYCAVGLDVVGCMRMPGLCTVYLGAPHGDAVLEFSVNETGDPGWSTAPGTGHLALAVDDLDATIKKLAAQGIEPEGPAYHPGGRQEARVAFYRDPDGNRVEIVNGEFPPPKDVLPDGLV